MKEIKSKMLAEFRDWFCEGDCQFYNMEGYCSCCPVKDERYWLEGAKKQKVKTSSEIRLDSAMSANTLSLTNRFLMMRLFLKMKIGINLHTVNFAL